MSEEIRPTEEWKQIASLRGRFFDLVSLISGLIAVASLVLFFTLSQFVPSFPGLLTISVSAGFLLTVLASHILNRLGRWQWAVGVLLAGMIVVMFLLMQYANGVSGPLSILLVAIPVAAGLLGGRRAGGWTVIGIAVPYAALAVLESYGVIVPVGMAPSTAKTVREVMLLVTLMALGAIASAFAMQMRNALRITEQRNQELADARDEIEQVAQAENEARMRAERLAEQLSDAIDQYVDYLDRVSDGEYGAELELEWTEQPPEELRALRKLGDYLTATMATLIETLQNMEVVQQRYVGEAWSGFVRSSDRLGFHYKGNEVEASSKAWLDAMSDAVSERNVVSQGKQLALPISLRDEVIGAVGLRRDGKEQWSDEEVALVEALVDQLAQTIEGLRLLDETQRRAASERLTREITEKMRRSANVEDIVQTAIEELYGALEASRTFVQLGGEDGEGLET